MFLFFLIIKMEVEELLKIVLQDGNKDCGVCSLLSIIRHYGGDVSREYLRQLTGTSKSGVSFYQLLEAASNLGFSCEGVKGEVNYLDSTRLPCIAHIIYQKKYQHFVVIYQIDFSKEEVTIMDPAKGRVVISISQFKLLSSGYFLYLMPVKTLPVFYERKTLLLFIKKFCYHYRFYLFLISLITAVILICQIITAFHFQYLFDYAISFSIYDSIFLLSFFLTFFYLIKIFFQILKDFILIKLSSIFDEHLLTYIYKQILLLPYLFFKNRTLGEVLERIQDVIKVKNFLLQVFSNGFTDLLFLIVFYFLLCRIHWKLSLVFLGYFFISIFIGLFFQQSKKKLQKKVLSKSDYIQSFLIESFQNVDTVKGLHLEYDFLSQFEVEYQKYLHRTYSLEKSLLKEQTLKQILYYGMYILFLGFAAYFIIHKELVITEFFIYQHIFYQLIGCGERLLNFFFDSYQIPLAVARIHDLFTLIDENFDGGTYYQLSTVQGEIVFSHLFFSYTSRPLFSDFSLTIPYGQKVLFTGESGGGKSSLVKMIMRYIDIPYGMLRIGSIDINHFHLDLLRNRISYVTGGELLFSNTLYYNITLNREVDRETVDEIVKLVHLDSVVEKFPQGYQTMVEENGFNFSGGERQRILLARALIKNSDIYIFDEAFHQIDIELEGCILKNIFSYLKDKTVIVISHRLQHLEFYDVRYRLEKGTVYEI